MNFLKKIFKDENLVVGLCAFNMMKPKYSENPIENDFFFNPFETEKPYTFNFETDYKKNVLLF